MEKIDKRDPIPEFTSLEEIAEFWDSHSTVDYEDLTHEVHFVVNLDQSPQPIHLMPNLGGFLEEIAQRQGVSVETLVNVWLTEKALELA